jgi:hypothetical protein
LGERRYTERSGKFHCYYQFNGERRRIRPWQGRDIDLPGTGGMVIAPPSKLAKGRYELGRRRAIADNPKSRAAGRGSQGRPKQSVVSRKGVWQRIFAAMSDDNDFEYLIIDSTIVRAHQHASGAQEGLKIRLIGRSRGGLATKIHLGGVQSFSQCAGRLAMSSRGKSGVMTE